MLFEALAHAAREFGGEGVGDVAEDEADRVGALPFQATRQAVAPVVEFVAELEPTRF